MHLSIRKFVQVYEIRLHLSMKGRRKTWLIEGCKLECNALPLLIN